jgi:hypothetical protein
VFSNFEYDLANYLLRAGLFSQSWLQTLILLISAFKKIGLQA